MAKPDDIEAGRAADQQLQRRGHRAEIGAQIDDVRKQQQPDDRAKQPARVMRADVAGDALAGDAADARADLLDRHHQREAEQHHPAHRVAELRAGLRVGGDAARIVVGGAGDQSRAESAEQPLARSAAGGAAPGDAGRQYGDRVGVGGCRHFVSVAFGCISRRYSPEPCRVKSRRQPAGRVVRGHGAKLTATFAALPAWPCGC